MQARRLRYSPVIAGLFFALSFVGAPVQAQTTWQQYNTNSECTDSTNSVMELKAQYSGIEAFGVPGQEESMASDPAILNEVKNDNWFMTGHKGHNAVLREVNYNTSHIYATYNTTYDGSQISGQTFFSYRCGPPTCEAGQLVWHGETVVQSVELGGGSWTPEPVLVQGGCEYAPILDIDAGCGDTTREQINNDPLGDIAGHMEDGSFVQNIAYCSTGTSGASGTPPAPLPTPDHPSPYTETVTSDASIVEGAPVTETLADGTVVTTTTKTETSNGGGTVSYVDTDGYDPGAGPIATYGNDFKGSETKQTVTEVQEKPDGTVVTITTITTTTVNPVTEFRDFNIPADLDTDYASTGGGSDTVTTTTTTTQNPDGSSTTETTTDGDGECVGDSCGPAPSDECPSGVDCTFDSSEADGLYDQLKESIEGAGEGGEVGAAVGEGDLPPSGVSSLPGYRGCQSLTSTWAGYSFTFPGVDGCAKVEVFKTILNWAMWVLLLFLLYSLVVRKPG